MEIQYGDKTFPVKNATKPLMKYHKGSSWDVFSNFVNDLPTDFFLDTTWGRFSYFEVNGKWYRLSIFDVDVTQCRAQHFVLVRKVKRIGEEGF